MYLVIFFKTTFGNIRNWIYPANKRISLERPSTRLHVRTASPKPCAAHFPPTQLCCRVAQSGSHSRTHYDNPPAPVDGSPSHNNSHRIVRQSLPRPPPTKEREREIDRFRRSANVFAFSAICVTIYGCQPYVNGSEVELMAIWASIWEFICIELDACLVEGEEFAILFASHDMHAACSHSVSSVNNYLGESA